ncbi:MAG: acetyl-CoA carboxylase, carboxyltransferase subunit beta [Phycisphaeraceae bacterium]|nr:acetyl-CoA carboxylase, carboxyltransferase subunit beta [Phycisphaeraceae bacterium]MCW5763928.1 acetyl-CoA carboxylase, carboxyltransferase subunit beta [Phycisphaeraceae bacterium]
MTQTATRTWAELKPLRRAAIPEGLWLRCPGCNQMIYRRQMEANLHVCPECTHHFRISATERIAQLSDPGTFERMFEGLIAADPMNFTDLKSYKDRLVGERAKTGQDDAVVSGRAFIKGRPAMLCCLDLTFMMGSMGCVVGETVTRAIELATVDKLPLIIVSCSGGARMQESGLSLMQMAKTSAALARFDDAGGLFISVLTDPTTGGVTASFAMLGDVIVAEPKALIGFAGPRVIRQTIRQDLPDGFQRSEFLLASGLVDRVVARADLRTEIARLIDYAGG